MDYQWHYDRANSYLDPFQQGGNYSPERVLSLLSNLPQVGSVSAGQIDPRQFQAGGWSGLQPYAQGAMDLGSRSAMIQAGAAAQGLGGMNPAARAAALSQIARGASANVGAMGLQGAQMGQQAQQFAGGQQMQAMLANQGSNLQADLANQGMQNQLRQGALGLQSQAMGNTYDAASRMAQNKWDWTNMQWQAQQARKAERRQRRASLLGGIGSAIGGLAGSLLGGPAGGMLGAKLFGGAGGGGTSQDWLNNTGAQYAGPYAGGYYGR